MRAADRPETPGGFPPRSKRISYSLKKSTRSASSTAKPPGKLRTIGRAHGTGTYQWFLPDRAIFETLDFHWDILQKRLRELAFLNRGLAITLRDERPEEPKERTYVYEGGIISFVEHLNDKKDPIHPIISTNGERDGVAVEAAMQWADTYSETIFAYANNIPWLPARRRRCANG